LSEHANGLNATIHFNIKVENIPLFQLLFTQSNTDLLLGLKY